MAKKSFLLLPRDEQADVIRPLMLEDGASYGSVAIKLHVKRGRIAGICRDYDIPTERSAGFADVAKSSSGVVLRLAVTEAKQCKAKVGEYSCGYERDGDSDYCGLPAHQALEKKRRA